MESKQEGRGEVENEDDGDSFFKNIGVDKNWKGKGKKKLKKLGILVDSPDQHSYTLVYTILLGIRLSVGRVSPLPVKELTRDDFDMKIKLKVPRSQLQMASTPRRYDFKFKDYSPMVFRHIRERFGIDSADYMMSLTSDYKLHEIVAEGKSGSLFFHSVDERFLIKTTTNSEAKFLYKLLPHYYQHIMKHPHTMITRIFGLHRVKPYKPHKKTHIIVMGNINVPGKKISERFDLKGSTVGRRTTLDLKKKGGCLKDLDLLNLNRKIVLGPTKKALMLKQLHLDVEFLQHMKIMDYSLLLCVHKIKDLPVDMPLVRRGTVSLRDASDLLIERERERNIGASSIKVRELQRSRQMKKIYENARDIHVDFSLERFDQLPIERGASIFQRDEGGFVATNANNEPIDEIYFFGIIDILQKYNSRKHFEHGLKALKYKKDEISADENIDEKSPQVGFIPNTLKKQNTQIELLEQIQKYRNELEVERAEILASNLELPRHTFKPEMASAMGLGFEDYIEDSIDIISSPPADSKASLAPEVAPEDVNVDTPADTPVDDETQQGESGSSGEEDYSSSNGDDGSESESESESVASSGSVEEDDA